MKDNKQLMKNAAYRHLVADRNKLIKRINFAEARLEKYSHALSDRDVEILQERINVSTQQLASVNDQIADIEEGDAVPKGWQGHASKALRDAS